MGVETAVAVTVASTAYNMYQSRKQSKADAEALNLKADAKRAQVFEMQERFEMNVKATKREAEVFKEAQIGAFAAGGVDVGSGSPLLALEMTNAKVTRQIENDRMEMESKTGAILAGADLDSKLANDVRKAGKRQQVGLFLQGASGVASNVNR